MVPGDPFEPISTTAPGKADKNYLFDAASLAYVNSFQLLKVISPTCMPFVSCSKTCHQKRRYGHALATVADGYRGLRFRSQNFQAELPSLPGISKLRLRSGRNFERLKFRSVLIQPTGFSMY
jgi:hypothetical protein